MIFVFDRLTLEFVNSKLYNKLILLLHIIAPGTS